MSNKNGKEPETDYCTPIDGPDFFEVIRREHHNKTIQLSSGIMRIMLCRNCFWFNADPGAPRGICRAGPPGPDGIWPPVDGNVDYCSQFMYLRNDDADTKNR